MTELTEAEIERLTSTLPPGSVAREWLVTEVERCIDARIAPILALADEWPETAEWFPTARLRAALSAHESAPQPHDGTGSHPDDERAADRVHNHPPYRPLCPERCIDGQLRGACLNDDGSPR